MSDLRQMITRKTAYRTAARKLDDTGKPQAIFVKADGTYGTASRKSWGMMKFGELVCTMQRPNVMFNGLFVRARWKMED